MQAIEGKVYRSVTDVGRQLDLARLWLYFAHCIVTIVCYPDFAPVEKQTRGRITDGDSTAARSVTRAQLGQRVLIVQFDIQMFDPSKAISHGLSPTGNVPRRVPSLALSLLTVSSSLFATQIFSPSKRMPIGELPTGNVPSSAPSLARSLVTVAP